MKMKSLGFNFLICVTMTAFSAGSLIAQEGLPPGITPGGLENDIINQVNNAGGAGGGNDGTAVDNVGGDQVIDGLLDTAGPEFESFDIDVNPDERNNRGFVGISLQNPDSVFPEYRFVGPNAESLTGSAAAGGNFGGRGTGGANGNGNTNGFNVDRVTPIRSRVVRAFRAPTVAPNFVAGRMNNRLSNLPATRAFNQSMSVSMQGRTAIISGTAQTQTQVDRIRRQLRLEPGVSRIESRVRLAPN